MPELLIAEILIGKPLAFCSFSSSPVLHSSIPREIPKVTCKNVQILHSRRFHISLDVWRFVYLCVWLLPQLLQLLPLLLRLLLPLRQRLLLGTGMQSICKFSLLCRVCKCSSIWLLSIFRCCYRLFRFLFRFRFRFPFAINQSVRVFCVISTLERIERCLPVCLSVCLWEQKPDFPCLSMTLFFPIGLCKWCMLVSWLLDPEVAPCLLPLATATWHCFVCCTRLCFGRKKGAELGKWRCNIRWNWIAQRTL